MRPPPVVTGISPAEGPPGTKVIIRGENLGLDAKDVVGRCMGVLWWEFAIKQNCFLEHGVMAYLVAYYESTEWIVIALNAYLYFVLLRSFGKKQGSYCTILHAIWSEFNKFKVYHKYLLGCYQLYLFASISIRNNFRTGVYWVL